MRRKVSLIGPSTLMVSLPSKWAKENRLSKGDEVDVEASGQSLVISLKPAAPLIKRISLDKKSIGTFTKNIIAYLYHKGYDEVRINFDLEDADEVQRKISHKIGELIGYEIVSQNKQSMTIKSLASERLEEFDAMLRRIFFLLLEMGERCSDAIERADYESLGKVSLLESENNKYTDFCKRMLNKYKYADAENTTFMYVILRDLEKIADAYRDICLALFRESNYKMPKPVLALVKETNRFLRIFYELFYKFDPKGVAEFHAGKDNIHKKTKELLLTSKGKETEVLHHLLVLEDLIFNLFGPFYTMKV